MAIISRRPVHGCASPNVAPVSGARLSTPYPEPIIRLPPRDDGTVEAMVRERATSSDSLPSPARGQLVPVVIAFAFGIAASLALPALTPVTWIGLAAVALAGSWLCRRLTRTGLLLLAVTALGAGRGQVTELRAPDAEDHLPEHGARISAIVQLRQAFTPPPRADEPAVRFAPHVPGVTADAEWLIRLLPDGTRHPMTSPVRVRIHVNTEILSARAGDRVRVTGEFRRREPSRNPGARDHRPAQRRRQIVGSIAVADRADVVAVELPDDESTFERRAAVRQWIQRGADRRDRIAAALLCGPPSDTPRRRAVLAALALGERTDASDDVLATFRGAGLAHVVALSGLHLALVIGVLHSVARIAIRSPRLLGLILAIATVGFLALVEVRVPVLRAGVLTLIAAAALSSGRRYRADGLLALTALILLWWRPGQLFEPGFQLSFGVVAGLIVYARSVECRLFGALPPGPSSLLDRVRRALRSMTAASITASLIATPLAAHHFGVVTLWTIPLTLITVPLVAVTLALAYGRLFIGTTHR